MYVYIFSIYLTLKTSNKIRRATDIISYSSSEKGAILMLLSYWSCPILLVVSQLPEVRTPPQLSWITRFRLVFGLALFRGCQGLVVQLQIVLHFGHYFLENTLGLGMLACSMDIDLNYWITMFVIGTGTNKSWQWYY